MTECDVFMKIFKQKLYSLWTRFVGTWNYTNMFSFHPEKETLVSVNSAITFTRKYEISSQE